MWRGRCPELDPDQPEPRPAFNNWPTLNNLAIAVDPGDVNTLYFVLGTQAQIFRVDAAAAMNNITQISDPGVNNRGGVYDPRVLAFVGNDLLVGSDSGIYRLPNPQTAG